MKLQVNEPMRHGRMRAHTATHLLHTELHTIFPQTKQAGSLVDQDYLRFDFYADRLLSDSEIQIIEYNINSAIQGAFPVHIAEMQLEDATALGAKAFFEDKYGDVVRVVSIDRLDEQRSMIKQNHSLELCGGTHVTNTKDIGSFVIIGQQAVASGIKRITAYTGPKVIEHIHEKNTLLTHIAAKLDCPIGQIKERLDKILAEKNELEQRLESTDSMIFENILHNQMDSSKTQYKHYNLNQGLTKHRSVKQLMGFLKAKNPGGELVFEDSNGGFLIWSDTGKAKSLMTEFGRQGGGNEQLCQGRIQSNK